MLAPQDPTTSAEDSRVRVVLTRLADRRPAVRSLAWLTLLVVGLMVLPADSERVRNAAGEAVALAHGYAREHIVLCLIPALFIAGALSTFVRPSAVMRFLGPEASKPAAYGIASVSGTLLSVCSCTVLPLFAGIWRMGAGLGPAVTFLFSGPAINLLAIILTARILGLELGIIRGVAAVVFSIVIGLAMALIFRKDASARIKAVPVEAGDAPPESVVPGVLLLLSLSLILIFANWSGSEAAGVFGAVARVKWWLVGLSSVGLGVILVRGFGVSATWLASAGAATALTAALVPAHPEVAFVVGTIGLILSLLGADERAAGWLDATWEFTAQIVPLLIIGVVVSGFLLGRPGHEGLVPSAWIEWSVGGSSLAASFFASIAGAFMYFATLTEVPIIHGLLGSGMGKGPALALLLAGPALSLPSMLAIRTLLGTRKTAVYVLLVVVMATLAGWLYGLIL